MVDDYHLLQRFVVQILLALVRYTGEFNDWTRLATAEGAEHGLRVPMRYANRLEGDTARSTD